MYRWLVNTAGMKRPSCTTRWVDTCRLRHRSALIQGRRQPGLSAPG